MPVATRTPLPAALVRHTAACGPMTSPRPASEWKGRSRVYRIGVVLERVFKTITRYNMFDPGHRVGVAVSGGADSVFLLHALLDLVPRLGLKLSVLHLDHGLRGDESRADAIFVRDLAARLGLPAFVAVTQLETADNL